MDFALGSRRGEPGDAQTHSLLPTPSPPRRGSQGETRSFGWTGPGGVRERASNSTFIITALSSLLLIFLPPRPHSRYLRFSGKDTQPTTSPVPPPCPPAPLRRGEGPGPGDETSRGPGHPSQSQGGTEDDTIRLARASQKSPSGLMGYCKRLGDDQASSRAHLDGRR